MTYSASSRVSLNIWAVYAAENLNQHADINLPAHDSHGRASILERSPHTSYGTRFATTDCEQARRILPILYEARPAGKKSKTLISLRTSLRRPGTHGACSSRAELVAENGKSVMSTENTSPSASTTCSDLRQRSRHPRCGGRGRGMSVVLQNIHDLNVEP